MDVVNGLPKRFWKIGQDRLGSSATGDMRLSQSHILIVVTMPFRYFRATSIIWAWQSVSLKSSQNVHCISSLIIFKESSAYRYRYNVLELPIDYDAVVYHITAFNDHDLFFSLNTWASWSISPKFHLNSFTLSSLHSRCSDCRVFISLSAQQHVSMNPCEPDLDIMLNLSCSSFLILKRSAGLISKI